jgi:hypothetical protein
LRQVGENTVRTYHWIMALVADLWHTATAIHTIAQASDSPGTSEWIQFGAIGGPFLAVVTWFAWKVSAARDADRREEMARMVALVAQRDHRIEQLEAEDREKDLLMQDKVLPVLMETTQVLNRVYERERRRGQQDNSPGRRWDD